MASSSGALARCGISPSGKPIYLSGSAARCCRMSVPLFNMCDLWTPLMESKSSMSSNCAIHSLTKGWLSPVKIASSTTADPLSKRRSHGTFYFFESGILAIATISPGYKSSVITFSHLPPLWTQIACGGFLMVLSLFIFWTLCITTVPSKKSNMPKLNKL